MGSVGGRFCEIYSVPIPHRPFSGLKGSNFKKGELQRYW